jgi:hypothetical protein
MGIRDYAEGRMDERNSNITKAHNIRNHITENESIRGGCYTVFQKIAIGDVGAAAAEMSSLLTIAESEITKYYTLARFSCIVSFTILIIIAIGSIIGYRKWKAREAKKAEEISATKAEAKACVSAERAEAEAYVLSVKDEIKRVKTLETLRNIMKLGVSSVTAESIPEIDEALKRMAFFIQKGLPGDRKHILKELEIIQVKVMEMAELLSELETEISPEAATSGQEPSS